MTEKPNQRQLQSLAAYPDPIYKDIDLAGLATFTIQWLQERHIRTTFENVVVALYKMFPAKFGLEGYPDYPDAARVGRTLLQLRPKYRNWARGSVQTSFVLTESGLSKAALVRQALTTGQPPPQPPPQRRGRGPRTIDLSKEIAPLEQSPLFQKWKEGRLGDAKTLEFLDMLGAYAYTPFRVIKDRVTLLKETASQLGRNDLVEFLESVRKTLEQRMNGSA